MTRHTGWIIAAPIVWTFFAGTFQVMAQTDIKPPIAKIVPKKLEKHGDIRIDNYYWLNKREDPAVIEYLNRENEYTQAMMASTEALQEKLFLETKARVKQTDSTVPSPDGNFEYYTRFVEGSQYPIHCRRPLGKTATEQVLLDVNKMAEGKSFCTVGGQDVTSDGSTLAYAVDYVGRRIFTVQFKNLETDELLPDEIQNVTGNIVWAEDNKTLFYARQDPKTLRSFQILRHRLGADPKDDVLVYQENDTEFSCGVRNTRSRKFILVFSRQTVSTEFRYLDAQKPESELVLFQPRQRDHEYSIDHLGDAFTIRTNWNAKNFRLMRAPVGDTKMENWKEVIPGRDDVYLEGFELFTNHLVLAERSEGLTQVRILSPVGKNPMQMPFGEPVYVARLAATKDVDTQWLRYQYTSLTTPNSTYEYNFKTGEKRLLKQEEILGGFDSKNYRTERLWVSARDGVRVPVSVVYHKDTRLDGSAPCLLFGYGSYGASMDPRFDSTNLNLLDRGFVYAIAHVRGGQELGRAWYENGKLFHKKNSFTDFIDVGRHLVESKYADAKRLYARGGSAGGLLMGAVVNLAPDLFHGVIADVPFVDVVTTMLDDSIPLTTFEYDEWGNPNKKDYYEYMKSYSPYDNLRPVAYPHMLVTTGLHDSQVQYWEPAKWVARLRVLKTDDHMLLLKTNMVAGHGGASGRFDRYHETALRHAFLLHLAGVEK